MPRIRRFLLLALKLALVTLLVYFVFSWVVMDQDPRLLELLLVSLISIIFVVSDIRRKGSKMTKSRMFYNFNVILLLLFVLCCDMWFNHKYELMGIVDHTLGTTLLEERMGERILYYVRRYGLVVEEEVVDIAIKKCMITREELVQARQDYIEAKSFPSVKKREVVHGKVVMDFIGRHLMASIITGLLFVAIGCWLLLFFRKKKGK